MKKEFILKQCKKCGATVEIIQDCTCENCGIVCCGEQMQTVVPNSVDASVEKHLPVYEVVGNYVVVTVPHVMEDEHYIEYVAIDSEKLNAKKYFNPGEKAIAVFPYVKGSEIYSYCNKHGIWKTIVE